MVILRYLRAGPRPGPARDHMFSLLLTGRRKTEISIIFERTGTETRKNERKKEGERGTVSFSV